MDKKVHDLDPQVAKSIMEELSQQTRQTFDKVVETRWQVTRTHLLLNAGGAAATLAFIGHASVPLAAIAALTLFVVGSVAGGVEIRVLSHVYSALHVDALGRRDGFSNGTLSVGDAIPSKDVARPWGSINNWSGIVSQSAFIIGSVVGVSLLLIYAP